MRALSPEEAAATRWTRCRPTAEVQAMGQGATPQLAADSILVIADRWQGELSPRIERERLKGKWAVQAAGTAAAVQTSALAAVQALAAI
jgi:hypothetical protein